MYYQSVSFHRMTHFLSPNQSRARQFLYLQSAKKAAVYVHVLYDFLVAVKVAPHECVIRTGPP